MIILQALEDYIVRKHPNAIFDFVKESLERTQTLLARESSVDDHASIIKAANRLKVSAEEANEKEQKIRTAKKDVSDSIENLLASNRRSTSHEDEDGVDNPRSRNDGEYEDYGEASSVGGLSASAKQQQGGKKAAGAGRGGAKAGRSTGGRGRGSKQLQTTDSSRGRGTAAAGQSRSRKSAFDEDDDELVANDRHQAQSRDDREVAPTRRSNRAAAKVCTLRASCTYLVAHICTFFLLVLVS